MKHRLWLPQNCLPLSPACSQKCQISTKPPVYIPKVKVDRELIKGATRSLHLKNKLKWSLQQLPGKKPEKSEASTISGDSGNLGKRRKKTKVRAQQNRGPGLQPPPSHSGPLVALLWVQHPWKALDEELSDW
ncbi:hypothetical protein GW7_15693 [Heterocephalus glaber]|uniref:Uncharacterized protein n=1 Tax=Heterocephalus glaber TaxID=10181 RepID=G5BL32_HETGA|nr:hypothetical protein GW7_15693 [Heterocephalus glaber]